MGYTRSDTFPELIATMKRAWSALAEREIPVLLGGGLAAWALGGPPTDHDVDLFVRERDAERAQEALVAVGMRPETPPEGWLLKAYDADVLVDLIFRPAGGAVDDGFFARAVEREVMAQAVLVASISDVLATKLLALTEQEPHFGSVLEMSRSLREQIDWELVRRRTTGAPFAAAFFTLVEELGIVAPGPETEAKAHVTLEGSARRPAGLRLAGAGQPPLVPAISSKGATVNSDRAEGKLKEAEGEAQQAWGDVKEKAGDMRDKAGDMLDDARNKMDGDDRATEHERAERA